MITLLNGLSFGFILFLLASGLSLIMGAMGVLNLAHGALYMIGAYVGWTVAVDAGAGYIPAVLAGAAAAGLVGLIMERGVFSRLRGRHDEQVLAAFGCLYILMDVTTMIWGPLANGADQRRRARRVDHDRQLLLPRGAGRHHRRRHRVRDRALVPAEPHARRRDRPCRHG